MIGKLYTARTPFYDLAANHMSFKARPALVLAKADVNDYVVLPVSSISIRTNIDPVYDIELDPAQYPKLNLKHTSYVRTHKQTIVHRADLRCMICDVRAEYEDLYLAILEKREEFSNAITKQAL